MTIKFVEELFKKNKRNYEVFDETDFIERCCHENNVSLMAFFEMVDQIKSDLLLKRYHFENNDFIIVIKKPLTK